MRKGATHLLAAVGILGLVIDSTPATSASLVAESSARRSGAVLLVLVLLLTVAVAGSGCVTVAEFRKLEARVIDMKRAPGAGDARAQEGRGQDRAADRC